MIAVGSLLEGEDKMKAIMLSIRPKYVSMILNGIKKKEIRSLFPKDYVGWVYIYCTKGKPYLANATELFTGKYGCLANYDFSYEEHDLNGKVVARFWCDKVEEYVNGYRWAWNSDFTVWGACNNYEYILKDACLTEDELYDYCEDLSFKAIHITKLEIFDKPKEISEFKQPRDSYGKVNWNADEYYYMELTKAPQSMCYIEVE